MKKIILYLLILLPAFFLWDSLRTLSAQPVTFTVSDEAELPSSPIKVQISASDFTDVWGFQGTIVWDDNVLEFNSITSTYPGIVMNFNTPLAPVNPTPSNKATFIWFDSNLAGVTIAGNPVLVELEFSFAPAVSIGTTTVVTIDNSVTDLFYSDNTLTELDPIINSGTITAGVGAFPVEMLRFEGDMRDANEVQLAWSTASELDNAFFEVQKSDNGREFRSVGEVGGAGTTTSVQSYTFTDRSAMYASNFYRLKQVDFNGTFAYSEIIEIRADAFLNQLSVFPNPARDQIWVGLIEPNRAATYTLIIRDINGNGVEKRQLAAGAFRERQQIDLDRLPRGMYQLELLGNDGQKYAARFIKE